MNSNAGPTQTENSPTEQAKASPQTRLLEKLSPLLEGLGYELVHLEMQMHQGKVLRLYIDRAEGREIDRAEGREIDRAEGREIDRAEGREIDRDPGPIGVEDCANVSRALDEPLDQMPEIDKAFGGAYELEVSSPGVDRPLRKTRDFEKFSGREVRIHTFRPLTADELGNADYQKRNPKQKNFLGRLRGVQVPGPGQDGGAFVKLTVLASMGASSKGKKPSLKKKETERKDEILLPMRLIAKANIEPDFNDFS
jgi:ribosome maturation factor RimP